MTFTVDRASKNNYLSIYLIEQENTLPHYFSIFSYPGEFFCGPLGIRQFIYYLCKCFCSFSIYYNLYGLCSPGAVNIQSFE